MLQLGQLVEALADAQVYGDAGIPVSGLAYDSRRIRPGDVFVPWTGGRRFGDGHHFIGDALERGAVAIVAQRGADFDLDATTRRVPVVLVPDSREALARLAARFYNFPSHRLRLIGITGTDGKTTTSYLIRSLLDQGDNSVGLIGTIHNRVGQRVIPADRTTPQSLDIQALLAGMVSGQSTAAVMEVASIALVQHRVTGCEFDVGVFTNLSPEHLDDHGSLDAYKDAKLRLFRSLGEGPFGGDPVKKGPKYAVINRDDPWWHEVKDACRVPVVSYGIHNPADYQAINIEISPAGSSFLLRAAGDEIPVQVPLPGRFNVYNVLAAMAVAHREGMSLSSLVEKVRHIEPVPGRFETVDAGQDFLVIVDYAHTAGSLEKVLQTAREFTPGRLLVVFGCGGDRDPGKRPQMGAVAARWADYIVITSDNPRSEDPGAIMEQVAQGARATGLDRPLQLMVDRAAAIRHAIGAAGPGDTVIIAGKGHETAQIFKDTVIPFNDREVALQALQSLVERERQ